MKEGEHAKTRKGDRRAWWNSCWPLLELGWNRVDGKHSGALENRAALAEAGGFGYKPAGGRFALTEVSAACPSMFAFRCLSAAEGELRGPGAGYGQERQESDRFKLR